MDTNILKRVAWLARLDADAEDLDDQAAHFDRLLAFVEDLEAADIGDVEPMAHPLDSVQRLREDQVCETDERERYQAGAPESRDGLFLVPKVIA